MSKIDNFSYEELKDICENSCSYSEIASRLGYSYGGNALKIIKKIINDNNFQVNLKTKTKKQKEEDKQALIGKQLGRLTVLKIDEEKTEKTKRTYYFCQCSCEQHPIVSIRADNLLDKNKPTRSCGCLSKEFGHEQGLRNKHDFTGYKNGKLTVIDYNEEMSKKHKHAYWNVQCECGRKYAISSSALARGQSSCGCEKSSGELQVSRVLRFLKIEFIQQYSFENLRGKGNKLFFDFYLPTLNILIECQGQQHYYPVEFFGGNEKFEQQKIYDNQKKEYCKNHNIQLIEIPYWDYNKINEDYLLKKIHS